MNSTVTLAGASSLIRTRRSIKPTDMDPVRLVDEAVLKELLENAIWAPSHGLTQPWRFFIFQGQARLRLAEMLQSLYRLTTPVGEFREDKHRKLGDNPKLAPVVIACVMERRGGAKITEIEEIEAVACAIQNLLLSATAAGLASFWSSPPLLEAADFQTFLTINQRDRCLGLIYLGWPRAGLGELSSMRQPASERTTWLHD